jgi:opacity protein-like surface antigen
MKRTLTVIVACLSLALVAGATDFPKMETFLGWNWVRFNPNNGFVPSFNANGGSGQFTYDLWHGIGATFEAGAVHNSSLGGGTFDTTIAHFLAGPRYEFHSHGKFMPFAEALFGGAYGTTSAQVTALPAVGGGLPGFPLDPSVPITTRVQSSHTNFAMMVGGGLNYKLDKHIAIRPFQVDYYLVRRTPTVFPGGNDQNVNNLRLAAGVVFLFGAK